MKNTFFALVVTMLTSQAFFAQNNKAPQKFTAHNKGKFFFYLGGNGADFTKSDIRFQGDGYDFTLNDVKSKDKPKGLHIDYFNPARMTIPQTNIRIGYFISDKYNISFGVDHMKYVMIQDQTVNINGYIDLPNSDAGSAFNGSYNNDPIVLTDDFLKFEHTDGLNYINVEAARFDDISEFFKINNTDKFQINVTEGIGAGVLYPKTNATLLGKERHDDFHVSGFGVSAKMGLNFTFFKYFFIMTELKGGYINMQDIRTTQFTSDKASQSFYFFEREITIGGIFKI
uniref:hypothetical protein n=1 Tax=Flavobacterium sp. TaxID=239 RepID=UPI00404938A1